MWSRGLGKLKKDEIIPVVVEATGMIMKTLTEYLKIILGNITTNKLQVEAVRGSVKNLKRALGTRLHERSFTIWFMNHDPLPKNRSGDFELWENFFPPPETHKWR